ncbi:hypothetical protein [Aureibaculum luteum]|uniref:hypothetical protein n=1 Tax=Aureibaculum luteum TaxID=1548456 RepID=UPI001E3CFA5B|nr:hypothetical protein [Aureibaculum luteum]
MAYKLVNSKIQFTLKIIVKNKACNPANGTVASLSDGFNNKNTINEKTKENENRMINVLMGKLIAITMKKNTSPSPNASFNLVFNLNLA